MGNRSFTRVVWMLLLLLSTKSIKAQQVVITTTVYSTHPEWATNPVVNICSGDFHIQTIIDNTGGAISTLTSFTQTIPQPAAGALTVLNGLNSLPCGTVWELNTESNRLTYTIPSMAANAKCTLDIVVQVPCNYMVGDVVTRDFDIVTQSTNVNVSIPESTVTVQLVKPVILIDNFVTPAGVPILYGTLQNLAYTPSTFRQFDIRVTNGIVDSFVFNYDPEDEIEFDSFQVYSCADITAPGCTVLTFYTQTWSLGPSQIFQLTGKNYLEQETLDFIRVREFFKVNECSPASGTNPATDYGLDIICGNRSPVQDCYHISTSRNANVVSSLVSPNGAGFSMTILPDLDICGIVPSDLIFKFTNSHPTTGDAPHSGDLSLDSIVLPLDTTWIHWSINDVYLRNSSGTEIPVSSFVNPLDPNNGFMPYSSTRKAFVFHFDRDDFNSSLNPVSPLDALIDGFIPNGFYNEFKENTNFSIVFKNVTFDCKGVNGDKTLFASCSKPDKNYLFFGTGLYGNPQYFGHNMCGTVYSPPHNTALGLINNFPEASLFETSTTDVTMSDPNVTLNYYFNYTGIDPNPSPFDFRQSETGWNAPGNTPPYPIPYFKCTDTSYYAIFKVPGQYNPLTAADVNYFPEPNGSTTAPVVLQTLPPEPGFAVYKISGDPVNYKGRLSINCSLNVACVGGGYTPFQFQLFSRCKEGCPDNKCDYAIICRTDSVFTHCFGGCGPGWEVGMLGWDEGYPGLIFDRTSFGWQDDQMATQLDANTPGVFKNRAYPCDSIVVESWGNVLPGANILDEVYYSIFYNTGDADGTPLQYAFFDVISARFENAAATFVYNLNVLTDISIVNVNGGTEYKFRITNAAVLAALRAQTWGPIALKAVLKVKDNIYTDYPPNLPSDKNAYFSLPQIRGQFKAIVDTTVSGSCDPWGDNMIILNVRTVSRQAALTSPEVPPALCYRRVTLSSEVVGGFTSFMEDFPNEFRPVMLWPSNTGSDFLYFTVPDNIHLSYITDTPRFSMNGVPVSMRANAVYDPLTHRILFDGYYSTPGTFVPNWPRLDNNGPQVKMALSSYLVNDCPVPLTPPTNFSINAPYTDHAYSMDPDCRTITNMGAGLTFGGSEYYVVMSYYASNPLILTSSQGTYNNALRLQLNYVQPYGGTYGSVYVKNLWIKVPASGDISILAINGVVPNANGYIILPDFLYHRTAGILLNITYRVNSCTADRNIFADLHYGFSCAGAPPADNAAYESCIDQVFTVHFQTRPSSLGFTVDPATATGSPCSEYQFLVRLNNASTGDIEEPFLTVQADGLTVTDSTYCINTGTPPCTQHPFGPFTTSGTDYTWDVDQSILHNNNGLPSSANTYNINITLKGNCSLAGTSRIINFIMHSRDVCNAPMADTIPVQIDFPAGNLANCPPCFSCDSLTLTYSHNVCNYQFTAGGPADPDCDSVSYHWDFGDGATLNTNNPVVSHLYSLSGNHTVSYTRYCYNMGVITDSCVVDTLINFTCSADPCTGTSFSYIQNGCSLDLTATPPTDVSNCDYLMYAWGYGDGTFSPSYSLSNVSTHTYTQSGTYEVCMGVFCYKNGEDNPVNLCKVCSTINVVCSYCDSLTLTYKNNLCQYDFDANGPVNPLCDSVVYLWNFGDGSTWSASSGTATHQYNNAGNYTVSYTRYCYNTAGVLLDSCHVAINIAPTCDPCTGTSFTYEKDGCTLNLTATPPTDISNCDYLMYAWGYGDGTYSPSYSLSNLSTHTYSQSGTYEVCMGVFCYKNGEDNPVNLCKVCTNIDVHCEPSSCSSLSLTYNNTDCVYEFKADGNPAWNCDSLVYLWNFGDGYTQYSSTNTVVHLYSTAGNYSVSYMVYCYDRSKLIDSCYYKNSIEVKDCKQEQFCLVIPKAENMDKGEAIASTADGGLIVAGSMYKTGNSDDRDMYVVKYKPGMVVDFSRRIGDVIEGLPLNENGFSVLVRNDGYFIAGSAEYKDGETNVFVVHLDLAGNVLWSKAYGGGNKSIDAGRKILDMSGNGMNDLMIVGFTNNTGKTTKDMDILVIKIDENGQLLKKVSVGTNEGGAEMAYDAIRLDGKEPDNYILVGEHSKESSTDKNIIVLKIDQDLEYKQSVIIDNSGDKKSNEIAYSVAQSGDHIYVAGTVTNNEDRSSDLYVVKLKADDVKQYVDDRVYFNSNKFNEVAKSIKKTTDGHLVIAGYSSDPNTKLPAALLGKISSANLDPDWFKVSAFARNDEAATYNAVAEQQDRSLIMTGMQLNKNNDYDILISKTSDKGVGCCTTDYPQTYLRLFNKAGELNKINDPDIKEEYYGNKESYYMEKYLCSEAGDVKKQSLQITGKAATVSPDISIVPNPNQGNFKISLGRFDGMVRTIKIMDGNGKIVSLINVNTKIPVAGYEVSVKNIAGGIYLVEVVTEKNKFTSKVLIQK